MTNKITKCLLCDGTGKASYYSNSSYYCDEIGRKCIACKGKRKVTLTVPLKIYKLFKTFKQRHFLEYYSQRTMVLMRQRNEIINELNELDNTYQLFKKSKRNDR